ncbi:ABC transporter substrate-binding protein [Alkaliphilus peptidifermentans]|uniref:Amino acid/amide ABC transporter substrate-binding protein, HAAT family (TC 3.A.1.4.-) n=1 Tax=Alkaliphilus peptidifermentans DSM 18978 TaxID=1120976 RepID=A0A1G5JEJ4_9FIRM|nr:ABC transporter substrate-binding protein [Alkaliphilus peptidifermentans]SCY86574.1 amino acid/amide ABC transporter substrate-binding protein, HAAT family (TC 3.A.1.4.-) [Alkaliphilus peptidifermentans DSM 18978]
MKKSICFLIVLVMMFALLAGCSEKAPTGGGATTDDDVIKIGVFEPITGANAAGGALEVEGAQLANKLYPEVLGKKVELVIADNKSDVVEAASAAARLVERDKVVAIIGSWGSSYSMAAGDIVRNQKVPAVAASATNPLVTLDNDFYFRVCFLDPFQGTVMANYAYNNLGARKVAIIREVNNDYAVGLAKFFEDAFVELTGDANAILEVTNYNTGDQDFSSQLLNISQKNPDVIFAPGNFTESALIIKQAKQLGIDIPFIGGDTWETPEFIDIGQQDVEGAVFSTFFTSEVPITSESEIFLKEYRAQYGKEPAAVTALGYDAYLVILDAIERAGSTDPEKIRDEIAKTKNFPGAAGIITLDENGDAVKSAVIKVVRNGEFVYLDTIEPIE